MANVRTIHKNELKEGPQTGGMIRKEAFTGDNVWVGEVRTSPGMMSGWHQHGGHDTYVYVVKGGIRLESGIDGYDATEVGIGDFVMVPNHTIHRESNPSNEESVLVVVRVGAGPAVYNVDGPEKPG